MGTWPSILKTWSDDEEITERHEDASFERIDRQELLCRKQHVTKTAGTGRSRKCGRNSPEWINLHCCT